MTDSLPSTDLSVADARQLTDEILQAASSLQTLVLAAYRGRVWIALGYDNWAAYCASELGTAFDSITRSQRQELVAEFSEAGMSNVAIGAVLGTSEPTVRRDLAATSSQSGVNDEVKPREILGQDGRKYVLDPKPTQPPEPEPEIILPRDFNTEEKRLKRLLDQGKSVVVSMRGDTYEFLIEWAKANDLWVRIDRASKWGNPFELPQDGDRDTVIANYRDHYLPHKPSLFKLRDTLRGGKVLGCWCAPEPCHGDVLIAWSR